MASTSHTTYEIIKFILERKIDDDLYQCCICMEKTEIFYIICKSECLDYSYCKKCIENIEKNRKKCPFTNIEFKYKDICLDTRKNKIIDKQKQIYNKIGNTIKNISINIETISSNQYSQSDNNFVF